MLGGQLADDVLVERALTEDLLDEARLIEAFLAEPHGRSVEHHGPEALTFDALALAAASSPFVDEPLAEVPLAEVPPLGIEDFAADLTQALSSAPGSVLAAALERGLSEAVPFGALPVGSSTAPWAQAMRMLAASRRLAGWGLWCQLAFAARLLAAWRACPPVLTGVDEDGRRVPDGAPDRCEESDPVLTERLQDAVDSFAAWTGGRLACLGKLRVPASQLADELVAAEVAVVAGLAPSEGRAIVEAADTVYLQGRLPRLGRALAAGWLDWPKVKVFVKETAVLDDPVARAVDALVLADVAEVPDTHDVTGESIGPGPLGAVDVLADPTVPGSGIPVVARWTVPQLRRAIRAAIAELDAAAAVRRAEKARRDRHVKVIEDLDGTAELAAVLPAEDAAAVLASLTQAAKAAKAAGDPRTLDQLRADELVHRATRSVHPGEYEASGGHEASGGGDLAYADAGSGDATGATSGAEAAHAEPGADGAVPDASAGSQARCACGRPVPVAFTQAFPGRPAKATLVSLTLPLSTFLGLSEQPGRLDGYGPVVSGLARRIAEDAARDHPISTTWRCVVVDDVHGTVLGVTEPVRTPEHDPPPRLRRLVEAMEPTCVFPGCRLPARRCDLDHRVPYDPEDPGGSAGGGVTCSCNLQPACRGHHRLKTHAGVRVRALTAADGPGIVLGTIEWTMPSGITVRRAPTVVDAGPIATEGPTAHPDVVTAARHLAATTAGHGSWPERPPDGGQGYGDSQEGLRSDWVVDTWRTSHERARAVRERAREERAQRAAEAPPF